MGIKAVANPPNPFAGAHLEWLDGLQPEAKLEVFEESAKSIVSTNRSPDLGFSHSINPYRGCFHACAYCYARPSHQYLDFGAGSDFEKKIVVKTNAAALLEKAFLAPSWKGELLVFSGNTDCYQPLEASYQLTKSCLEVCRRFRNPVTIITKGALIRRDLELLQALAAVTHLHVIFSAAFADDQISRQLEPHAPRPSLRFRAMKELADAGISVGVSVSPLIPGLNESDMPKLLERAAACGASTAFMTLLRLPAEVEAVFSERLLAGFPQKAKKVLNGIKEMKGGALNRSAFGARMKGDGSRWDAVEWMFRSSCERFGLKTAEDERVKAEGGAEQLQTFRRPTAQLELFGEKRKQL